MTPLAHTSVTAAGATVYTVPVSFKCDITDILIVNTTSAAISFSMYFVPNGGTFGNDNAIFVSANIPANTTVTWEGIQSMRELDYVYCSSSATGITVRLTGEEHR